MTCTDGRPHDCRYSDGRDFVRVGPRGADKGEGQFAAAVQQTVIVSPRGGGAAGKPGEAHPRKRASSPPPPQPGGGGDVGEEQEGEAPEAEGRAPPRGDEAQALRPELRDFLAMVRAAPPLGLPYEHLPTPKAKGAG